MNRFEEYSPEGFDESLAAIKAKATPILKSSLMMTGDFVLCVLTIAPIAPLQRVMDAHQSEAAMEDDDFGDFEAGWNILKDHGIGPESVWAHFECEFLRPERARLDLLLNFKEYFSTLRLIADTHMMGIATSPEQVATLSFMYMGEMDTLTLQATVAALSSK